MISNKCLFCNTKFKKINFLYNYSGLYPTKRFNLIDFDDFEKEIVKAIKNEPVGVRKSIGGNSIWITSTNITAKCNCDKNITYQFHKLSKDNFIKNFELFSTYLTFEPSYGAFSIRYIFDGNYLNFNSNISSLSDLNLPKIPPNDFLNFVNTDPVFDVFKNYSLL